MKYWIGVGWLTNIFNKMLCKQNAWYKTKAIYYQCKRTKEIFVPIWNKLFFQILENEVV